MFQQRSLLGFFQELALKIKQFWAKVTPIVLSRPLKPWGEISVRQFLLASDRFRRDNGFYNVERRLHPGLDYYGCTVGVALISD